MELNLLHESLKKLQPKSTGSYLVLITELSEHNNFGKIVNDVSAVSLRLSVVKETELDHYDNRYYIHHLDKFYHSQRYS